MFIAEKERDGGDTDLLKPFGLCFAALKPEGGNEQ